MEIIKMGDNVHKGVKSVVAGATRFDEIHGSTSRSGTQQEVIKDSQVLALRAASSSGVAKAISKEEEGLPELTQRMSRVETVRQDARKLKSATLNRMGKMFKQRSQTPVAEKSALNVDGGLSATKSVENCSEERSKKEKSNSLGRILKLVDKDGSPRKLFHPRTGSLSRILRRHPNNESNDNKRLTEDNTSGIFSRMLSQFRGRPSSGNSTIEPNIETRKKMSSLPPKAPPNSRAANLSSSTSSSPPSCPTGSPPQKLTNFEYSV